MERGVFLEEMEEEIDVVKTVVAEIEAAERAERMREKRGEGGVVGGGEMAEEIAVEEEGVEAQAPFRGLVEEKIKKKDGALIGDGVLAEIEELEKGRKSACLKKPGNAEIGKTVVGGVEGVEGWEQAVRAAC